MQNRSSTMKNDNMFDFEIIANNEKESYSVLQMQRPKEGELIQVGLFKPFYKFDGCQILYLSDLHLDNIIAASKCESMDDVHAVLERVGKELDKSYEEYANRFADDNVVVIIDGDITHSPHLFESFTGMRFRFLRKAFIILGNHELWEFPGSTVNEIVAEYIELSSVPILNNEIIIFEDSVADKNQALQYVCYHTRRLSYDAVMNLSTDELSKQMHSARMILLAGIGFSGCNNSFNANNGIYRDTLSREQEIIESEKFATLYDRFIAATRAVKDRVLVVATHMPIDDWKKNPTYEDGVVYISGHTHRNFFHDDGIQRVYADNQNGYFGRHPSFKCIYCDDIFDPFISYEDGIYEITKFDYILFYRARRMSMQLSREYSTIYLLKKNNNYCFLARLKSGKLSILNGGRGNSLSVKDVDYYYNLMDEMVDTVTSPLNQYTSIQKQISDAVKSFGGLGRIHGCIVDIDFYNHIYVNPFDLTIKGYYALDMVKKWVYTSIPAMLEKHSPNLYRNYQQLLETQSENALIPLVPKNRLESQPGEEYFETDIYKASREISRMQKIYNNILCYWNDSLIDQKGKYLEYTKKRQSRSISPMKDREETSAGKKPVKRKKGASLKEEYLGITRRMNCGMNATVIDHINYKNITIQFEDGFIKHGVRMDDFMNGKVPYDA